MTAAHSIYLFNKSVAFASGLSICVGESQPSGSSKTSEKNLKLIQANSISAVENMMDLAIL